jgi:hypothetical protein
MLPQILKGCLLSITYINHAAYYLPALWEISNIADIKRLPTIKDHVAYYLPFLKKWIYAKPILWRD